MRTVEQILEQMEAEFDAGKIKSDRQLFQYVLWFAKEIGFDPNTIPLDDHAVAVEMVRGYAEFFNASEERRAAARRQADDHRFTDVQNARNRRHGRRMAFIGAGALVAASMIGVVVSRLLPGDEPSAGTPVGAESSPPPTQAAPIGTGAPFGCIDSATRNGNLITVRGWVVDPDTPDQPVIVGVTAADWRYRWTGQAQTGLGRPDVASAVPGAGPNQGFEIQYEIDTSADAWVKYDAAAVDRDDGTTLAKLREC